MDEVYGGIVEDLVAAAARHGRVAYGVPGSPLVVERTVELLRARAATGEVALEVVPGLSFLDLAWERLGIDPLPAGVRLVDAHRFAVGAAGDRRPLLVGQADSAFALSEVKLAVEDGPVVTVLQRLGLPDERVGEVAWHDLDREVEADHLTTLWVPQLADAGEVIRNWDAQKWAELARAHGPLDGIPPGLPALQLAAKALRRAGALAGPAAVTEAEAAAHHVAMVGKSYRPNKRPGAGPRQKP